MKIQLNNKLLYNIYSISKLFKKEIVNLKK